MRACELPSSTFALRILFYCMSILAVRDLFLMGVVDHRLRVIVELRHVWHLKNILRNIAFLNGGHNTVDELKRILGHRAVLGSKMIQHGTYL